VRRAILLIVALFGAFWWGASTTVANADSNRTATNKYDITIDGNFDDWSGKPMTEVKENGDDYNIKRESLVADDDNIYFYLNMSPEHGGGYSTLQPSGYVLNVGSKTFYVTFKTDGTLSDDTTVSGTVNAWNSENGGSGDLSQATMKVHRYKTANGHNDIMEARIPLSELKVAGGSQTITMKNANLGTQTLTATGGSTGPFILAGIGMVIALGGAGTFIKTKSKSKKQRNA